PTERRPPGDGGSFRRAATHARGGALPRRRTGPPPQRGPGPGLGAAPPADGAAAGGAPPRPPERSPAARRPRPPPPRPAQRAARRSAQQIKDAIDFIGGSLNADADTDYAVVGLHVLRKDLDTGLDLLADVLLHPAFKSEELARQRDAVLAAIRADEDDPTSVAQKAFQRALFGETPYGHPEQGTDESVRRITRADVQDFFRRYYGPSRAAVVVVGDLSPAEARERFASVLRDWRGAPVPPFVYPPLEEPPARRIEIDRPVTQAGIVMGNIGIARDNPDYEAVAVMDYVFGSGGFSSRLMDHI